MPVGYLLYVKAMVSKVGFLPTFSLQKRLYFSKTEINSPFCRESTEIEINRHLVLEE